MDVSDFQVSLGVFVACFVVAAILGAVVNRTNFCAMGAVSDWVNMGDRGRLGAWFLAIAVATLGVLALESFGVVSLADTRPPYRSANFAWLRYLLGGLMFGVGMTLASGCASKTLVRLGGGNIKSLVVLGVVGVFAYLMTKTDFYGVVFYSWMQPLSVDLGRHGFASQDVPALLAGLFGWADVSTAHAATAVALAVAILVFVGRTAGIRGNADNLAGGIAVGACVTAGWFVTGGSWGRQWIEDAKWLDRPPLGVGVQSFTFVNPAGETMTLLASPTDLHLVTFGVIALVGVVAGSLAYSLSSGRFRVEWFRSWGDFASHAIGGALMGIGGVLALGCTIGQGVTGTSTLAVGSFVALGSIILGSATTMKVQFYKMVYEEASWLDALLSGWADLHLLPDSVRRLDAV